MKRLQELAAALAEAPELPADAGRSEVSAVVCDSRTVKPGALFAAVRGGDADGHTFLQDAVKRGAGAVLVQAGCADKLELSGLGVPVLTTADSREAYSRLAAAFYDRPSSSLCCLGVTGTNGKTSAAWIAANVFARCIGPAGLLGTLGAARIEKGRPTEFRPLRNTTPDPEVVQANLADALAADCRAAVIEATSQGLVQSRTADVEWDCAVFTNLSRDHLDLHNTLEEYGEAKYRLFSEELARSRKPRRSAVLWTDDETGAEFGRRLSSISGIAICRVGESAREADYRVSDVCCTLEGTSFTLSKEDAGWQIQSRLLGRYNVANTALALVAVQQCGCELESAVEALSVVPSVPGRLEPVAGDGFHLFIDYAHTPDALVSVQRSLKELCSGRLITVFGCGGDRDRGKRPLMGRAVAETADLAVTTSDNPRTEDPARVIEDILPGLSIGAGRSEFRNFVEPDRRKAIRLAIELAEPGDIVLVAGKGHEDYQEVHGVRHPFSDSSVCREVLQELGRAGR